MSNGEHTETTGYWTCARGGCTKLAHMATAVSDANGEALCPEHGEEQFAEQAEAAEQAEVVDVAAWRARLVRIAAYANSPTTAPYDVRRGRWIR